MSRLCFILLLNIVKLNLTLCEVSIVNIFIYTKKKLEAPVSFTGYRRHRWLSSESSVED